MKDWNVNEIQGSKDNWKDAMDLWIDGTCAANALSVNVEMRDLHLQVLNLQSN